MCKGLEGYGKKEREKGREEGREEGRILLLEEFVKKGIITAENAAAQEGMTTEEFSKALDKVKTSQLDSETN